MNVRLKFNPRICIVVVPVLVVALIITIAAAMEQHARKVRHTLFTRLKGSAGPSLLWLQAYKAQNGSYPETLPSELTHELEEQNANWWYSAGSNRTSCGLGFGKYSEDGFVFYWSSETGAWFLDD